MTEPTGPLSQGVFRSARRLLERKGRLAAGEFLAEGPQAVKAALALAGDSPLRVLIGSPGALARHDELVATARALGADVREATADQLRGLTDAVHPQGLVAICRVETVALDDVLAARPRLVAVCAQIRDPGNLGTVIRSADAFGADAVIVTHGSVDLHNPKTVRASVGSLFNLPVVTGIPLATAVDALRGAGLRTLAADGAGDTLLTDLDLTPPTAWILGNEAWGLPAEDAALADQVVSVPIWGRAESLNLASAATVCLFATAAAQR